MVLMDKNDYIIMAQNLLKHTNTYRPIAADPTNKHKSKVFNLLKTKCSMDDNTYRRMYPTGVFSPKLYGLPKIHQKDAPLGQ